MNSFPDIDIPRQHLVAVFSNRDDLMQVTVGRGRIVGEYFFGSEAEHRFAAIIECPDEQTARELRAKLPFSTNSSFSHSEALTHVFALGAKTTQEAADLGGGRGRPQLFC